MQLALQILGHTPVATTARHYIAQTREAVPNGHQERSTVMEKAVKVLLQQRIGLRP